MKKTIISSIAIAVVISLGACSGSGQKTEQVEKEVIQEVVDHEGHDHTMDTVVEQEIVGDDQMTDTIVEQE